MKQVKYIDRSLSRAIEEDQDWEATGQEEMNALFENSNGKNKSILDCRDDINNLRDLVDVCGSALLSEEGPNADRTFINVAHVLHFYVDPILKNLEKELAKQ